MRTRRQFQIDLKNEEEVTRNLKKVSKEQLRWIKWADKRLQRYENIIIKLGGKP